MVLAADGLPVLREVVQAHGLSATKALGQNFLFDLNLTGRIARAAGRLEEVTVVEVGPGPGGLTRALLMHGARHVIAVEKDPRCLAALREVADHYPGRLTVVSGDALAQDWRALVEGAPAIVVANLPYNVATVLLTQWLTDDGWPPWWQSLTLMFQREVAERIVATPETPGDHGRLSVLAGWRAMSRILFDVPPSAFVPPPKVTSSVVQLLPLAEPMPCRRQSLEAVTRAAFGQRRKMLRQSLKGLGGDIPALLAAAGVDPTARAEELSVAEFVALANAWRAPGSP